MRRTKYLLLIMLLALTALIFIPNISNADTEYTYSDTEQEIQWSYEINGDNNIVNLKLKTTGKTGAVTIPSTMDGKTVISLKSSAFAGCTGITSITIPNTITSISESGFEGCTGLKSVTLPNSITKIGSYAFSSCSGIATITFSNNLSSIGSSAFYGCSGLSNVTLPNSVTTLGNSAFEGCSGIKELTLSNNLSAIPNSCFDGCSGLKSVKLPSSVTSINGSGYSSGAFYNCTGLTKILIPDSVVSIGKYAFQNCSKLTIYGNDGQTSKEFAEENDISFDYIANWDKQTSGGDVTAPTVKSIYFTYASVSGHEEENNLYKLPAGSKVVIVVSFSEDIKGSTVPTLTIKFGDGENIKVTEGTVGGSKITYVYTIKNTDKGVLTTVDLSGGNITDGAGNKAKLSCPAMGSEIDGLGKHYIYANGSGSSTGTSTSTTNSEWTDFSNAKFELVKDGKNGVLLEISGVEPKGNNVYQLIISSNNNKPNISNESVKEKMLTMNYDKEKKIFYNRSDALTQEYELNQKLFASIVESSGSQQEIVIYGKELTRFEEEKILSGSLLTWDSSQVSANFTCANVTKRKLQIKIGKITDNTILKKIKNEDSSGFADLLSYAKSNNGIFDGIRECQSRGKLYFWYHDGDGLIDLGGKIQDGAYYYLYVKTDDENGKYISNEGITFGLGKLTQSVATEETLWRVYFYGDNDFKWADFGDTTTGSSSTKDTTIAEGTLPQTGETILVVSAIGIVAVIAVVARIKSKKYNF